MAEDEVVVGAVVRAAVMGVRLRRAVSERDGARRAVGLGRSELAADEAPAPSARLGALPLGETAWPRDVRHPNGAPSASTLARSSASVMP